MIDLKVLAIALPHWSCAPICWLGHQLTQCLQHSIVISSPFGGFPQAKWMRNLEGRWQVAPAAFSPMELPTKNVVPRVLYSIRHFHHSSPPPAHTHLCSDSASLLQPAWTRTAFPHPLPSTHPASNLLVNHQILVISNQLSHFLCSGEAGRKLQVPSCIWGPHLATDNFHLTTATGIAGIAIKQCRNSGPYYHH